MCARFRLVPKSMTLDDLWAKFKVINSLNATEMAKYSIVLTPTPCRVAGCIISIRPTYSCADALSYLFTYLHSFLGSYKTGNISKTVEDRVKVTINGLYKVVHGFWFPPKCVTLNDLCVRFKFIDSLNVAKMAKYSLVMISTPCKVAGCIISVGRA